MTQFWYTRAGRTFVEHTMPEIARHLGRIATAVEKLALDRFQEDTIREYPRCEWCDHRHFPTARCLVEDCECQQ